MTTHTAQAQYGPLPDPGPTVDPYRYPAPNHEPPREPLPDGAPVWSGGRPYVAETVTIEALREGWAAKMGLQPRPSRTAFLGRHGHVLVYERKGGEADDAA